MSQLWKCFGFKCEILLCMRNKVRGAEKLNVADQYTEERQRGYEKENMEICRMSGCGRNRFGSGSGYRSFCCKKNRFGKHSRFSCRFKQCGTDCM